MFLLCSKVLVQAPWGITSSFVNLEVTQLRINRRPKVGFWALDHRAAEIGVDISSFSFLLWAALSLILETKPLLAEEMPFEIA